MPAFRIHDPKCVFIHNPKTGGGSIRRLLLPGGFDGPVVGELPQEWMGEFKFAFVRNPFDRLVSAWKMFSEGVQNSDWTPPRDARLGISLAEFMKVVLDESIRFGSDRSWETRVRNHTLPQVHWYYGIDQADFLGRFEDYDRDTARVWKRLGLPEAKIDITHSSSREHFREYFDKSTRHLAEEYYAEDLGRFAYSFDD